jgi:hypothetical protein
MLFLLVSFLFFMFVEASSFNSKTLFFLFSSFFQRFCISPFKRFCVLFIFKVQAPKLQSSRIKLHSSSSKSKLLTYLMSWLCSSFVTLYDLSRLFSAIVIFHLNQVKLIFGCVCVVAVVCGDGCCGDGNHGHNNGGHHCVVHCYFLARVALCGIGCTFLLLVFVELFCYYFSWPWSCSFVFPFGIGHALLLLFFVALVALFCCYSLWP